MKILIFIQFVEKMKLYEYCVNMIYMVCNFIQQIFEKLVGDIFFIENFFMDIVLYIWTVYSYII